MQGAGNMADNTSPSSLDPCRLQTSTAPLADDDCQFSIHSVLSQDDNLDGIGDSQTMAVESICLAWAVLLRIYLATDTVTFGFFEDEEQSRSSPAHDGVPKLVDGVKKLAILQYHAVSGRTSHERNPDTRTIVSEADAEAMPINTAVRQCETKTTLAESVQSGTPAKWIVAEVLARAEHGSSTILLRTRKSRIPFAYGESIARTFRSILVESTCHREAICFSLPMVGHVDKQLLKSWYGADLFFDPTCLHHSVELTANSKPNEEAICAWDGSMTYRDLDKLSTSFAKQLCQTGVQVGDLVPLSFEKSLYAVVAALAILKAGAAFVPLDPNHPTTRLEEILETVQAKLVVTSAQWQQKYVELGKKTLVVSTRSRSDIEKGELTALPNIGSQDAAFVLFTSGSTGQPKGMLHDHGAAVTHSIANGKSMGYDARVFQFSAFTFDMAVWDMFSTLILGGCICIPSDENRLNNISEAMNSMGVEFAFLTPSVASLLKTSEISTLKRLACGGEVFRQEIAQRWQDKIELINQYGIAEVGTIATRNLRNDAVTSRTGTVGYTLPTLRCVFVDPDDHNQLVPIGAIGELLVTGTTVSRGYINSEAKNRSSFISNPAWADDLGLKDRVFYKTGDLLQYNVGSFDGKIDFMRRKDGQLKYHGQRMEAGEVEHHLGDIPGVTLSAVVIPDRGCFSGQLVAAVEMSSAVKQKGAKWPLWIDHSQTLTFGTVKAHLSRSLPGYMIPAEYLVIGIMPLTPSGKVDRKSIKTWFEGLSSRPDEPTVAGTHTETSSLAERETTARAISLQIAGMISSRDHAYGVQLENQDFLLQSAGVDSIQTASLAMFVQNTFGIKLPLSVLLSSSSTVRDVARMIDMDTVAPDDHIVDLVQEVESHARDLFDNIKSSSPPRRDSTNRHVFLTGASGYLGTKILHKLLQGSKACVTVLTRCPSIAEAFEQIRCKAVYHGWWHDTYASRIDIWQGDLTEPGLGLKSVDLDCLRGKNGDKPCIDTIIHNGAKVHYNLDYEALKASNLQSTKDLISIAADVANISTFIYISGGRPPSAIELSEAEDVAEAQSDNGYAQSKFVAEYLVRRCMECPAFATKSVRIIRPGYIVGSPKDGIANLTDFIWRLIAGCVGIQSYNEDDENHWLFVSDAEHVAEVATSSVTRPVLPGVHGVDQILDGIFLKSLWQILSGDCGYSLKPLPHDRWLQVLKSAIMDQGESHLLFPLLHTLQKGEGMIGSKNAPLQDTETSRRVEDSIRANVKYLIKEGFLGAPIEHGTASMLGNDVEEHLKDDSDTGRSNSATPPSSRTKSSSWSNSTKSISSTASSVGEDTQGGENKNNERLLGTSQTLLDASRTS
ncbi:MAG: hypothetical protein Q9186_005722 [Xanthomendoza sp. 1 TL-2023]